MTRLPVQGVEGLGATLERIAWIKQRLPLPLAAQVDSLGLHVRWQETLLRETIRAGGKLRPCFEAQRAPGEQGWKVVRLDCRAWDRRFAHLVGPTREIAEFLWNQLCEFGKFDTVDTGTLNRTIRHYKSTGLWLGLQFSSRLGGLLTASS